MTVREGVRLFNQGEFYEAHEVWESMWTEERGARRLFLQALIHMAVGLHHERLGNRYGAERQLRKGLRKLAGYLPCHEGMDTRALYRVVLARVEGPIQSGVSAPPVFIVDCVDAAASGAGPSTNG